MVLDSSFGRKLVSLPLVALFPEVGLAGMPATRAFSPAFGRECSRCHHDTPGRGGSKKKTIVPTN